MLTPKDKAIELYCKYIDAYNDRNLQVSDYKFAKQCALIAVDEILNSYPHTYDLEKEYLRGGGASVTVIRNIRPNMNYWQEVKKEIEAL
jgi:D-alanine-D-alanine ligase-like ATP-grasp enzyme